jgi:hypothetical protein
MGMYCACGVKKREGWVCECDWDNWYLCFEDKDPSLHGLTTEVPVKKIPDKDGTYQVRVFEDGDYDETESEFSLTKKNWGENTNQMISHWKVEYFDGWVGYRGVYAWKKLGEDDSRN